jgi:hypothetical protein
MGGLPVITAPQPGPRPITHLSVEVLRRPIESPPPPPGASPPPLWGSEDHLHTLFGERVEFTTVERRVLNVTAFQRPTDWGEHFQQRYGPTITTRAHAGRNGRDREFDDALAAFCHEWNLGSDE